LRRFVKICGSPMKRGYAWPSSLNCVASCPSGRGRELRSEPDYSPSSTERRNCSQVRGRRRKRKRAVWLQYELDLSAGDRQLRARARTDAAGEKRTKAQRAVWRRETLLLIEQHDRASAGAQSVTAPLEQALPRNLPGQAPGRGVGERAVGREPTSRSVSVAVGHVSVAVTDAPLPDKPGAQRAPAYVRANAEPACRQARACRAESAC
jgi:hypothetical protein